MTGNAEVQRHIADIDSQLRTLRGETSGEVDEVGNRADGALDSEDEAAALTNIQENEALIANLEQRRQSLLDSQA